MTQAVSPSQPVVGLWGPCRTLWRREMVRFLRQRGRIVGALGTPLLFWVLVGAGLKSTFSLPTGETGMSYLEFSYPGAIGAILMFTAIFSTISIIEDRREGFLQGVLVSPAPRTAIALGKLLGASTLAVGQATIFLLLAPFAGIRLGVTSVLATIAAMSVVGFGVTGLGFYIAWRTESVQGFHAVMNLVLMPILVLSGAFFPPSGSAAWLAWIMAANPMTYGVSLLRYTLYMDASVAGAAHGVPIAVAVAVSVGFALVMLALSVACVRRKTAIILQ